eukprot:TRINITY_DN12251_c0_g1_i1.p1 TRINITY_DN12251_c0_g1~~TRINITY_DN12251_c0_g1_i1.p1  ORF type:complete len:285 (-),score=30.21 TRINITY_DN12251_c0_g1_i1:8-862(-)
MDEYWKGIPYYQEQWRTSETSTKIKIIAIIFVVAIVISLTVLLFIPGSFLLVWLEEFIEWLDSVDVTLRAIILFVAQLIAVMLCLPGTVFNLACGFSLGFWLGALVSVASTDLAALFSFLITRYLAKDWAAEQVAKRPSFAIIDNTIRHSGWYLIFLIRLSPVFPFGLCNYLFGLAEVSLPVYWLSSTLGLIPYTLAYTYIGSLLGNVADIFGEGSDESDSGTSETIVVIVGVVMTLITIVVIGYVTKKEVQKAIKKAEEKDGMPKSVEDLEVDDVIEAGKDDK